jgi:hypothetical protein
MQPEIEDKDLKNWRESFAEIEARKNKLNKNNVAIPHRLDCRKSVPPSTR